MNKKKLKEAKTKFLNLYPGGFDDPGLKDIEKKHKPAKMEEMAREFFSKDAFSRPEAVLDNMVKIISRSSMVSLFEKPVFRDFVKGINDHEKEILVKGLEEFLHGNQEFGFNSMLDVLQLYKLGKWTLLTIIPHYYYPETEVYVKPSTTKMAIKYFELENLVYKPKPNYEFYKTYRSQFQMMKDYVKVTNNNAAFGGFILITVGDM